MICVDHLCYHYKGGRPILRDVSFELETGHFLAVLGNNGVSISQVLQKASDTDSAELVVITDTVRERHIRDALTILSNMSMVHKIASVIRVY